MRMRVYFCTGTFSLAQSSRRQQTASPASHRRLITELQYTCTTDSSSSYSRAFCRTRRTTAAAVNLQCMQKEEQRQAAQQKKKGKHCRAAEQAEEGR